MDFHLRSSFMVLASHTIDRIIHYSSKRPDWIMNDKLKWFIYIFIAVATALGVAFTSSDAGLIDCLLVGLGNGALNFFLVERVFKKD